MGRDTHALGLSKMRNDLYLNSVVLDEGLKQYIFNDMPNDYSLLEKALYVYIKLCKTLTYDEEFYSNNQKGMSALIHQDIKRLNKVNLKNNKIVCYEFSYIFAKFLQELDVDFLINGENTYGDNHTFITLSDGKFLLNADPLSGIIGGDLYNAKTNNNLVGLNCQNKDNELLKEFSNLYKKVYQNIIMLEEEKETDQDYYEMFLEQFEELCEQEQVSISQKKDIFENQSKCANSLPDMERITYTLKLARAVFSQEKEQGKFDVAVISRKTLDGIRLKSSPAIILSFNEKTFDKAIDSTTYQLLNKDGILEDIDKATLKNNFSYGAFSHITAGTKKKHFIPGIDNEGDENVK